MTFPICAIFPVYECADRLRDHLRRSQEWLLLVEQVVVVASHSTDGTLQVAREMLDGTGAEILPVPPGLYPAWNTGIARAGAEYVYISTVGDGIDACGLGHLLETIVELECDVLISPPRCVHEDGSPAEEREFPIHQLLAKADVSDPVRIPRWLAYTLATGFSVESLLGSSASNLYRREFLQRHPFPANFGKAGDAAWLRRRALSVRLGLTPRVCADFLLHQDHGARPHGELTEILERLQGESECALAEARASSNCGSELALLNAWRLCAGVSPERTLDAIRHLEGIAAKNEEQRAYIGDLEAELSKMREAMELLDRECDRRGAELKALQSLGGAELVRRGVARWLQR